MYQTLSVNKEKKKIIKVRSRFQIRSLQLKVTLTVSQPGRASGKENVH